MLSIKELRRESRSYGGGGWTQPLRRDGGMEELDRDPTVGPVLLFNLR